MSSEVFCVIGQLCQGGGERVCVNLCNEFANMDRRVNLVVLSNNVSFFKNDIDKRVNLIIIKEKNLILRVFKLYRVLNCTRRREIISFNYNISFYLSLFNLFTGLKYNSRSLNTLSLEFSNRRKIKDKIIKKMVLFGLNHSEKVISQSNGMRDDLVKCGVKSSRIVTINNPISPKYIGNGVFSKEKYILFVGRLSEQKAIDYLLYAMVSVNNDYKLLIIGQGSEYNNLLTLVNKLNLSHRVSFLGEKSDLVYYYRHASLTVLSSRYEGFPNVLVESIACGTPVVSFDCPNGPREIIIDGVNGFLVKYLDYNDLAVKINYSLSFNFNLNKLKESISKFESSVIADTYINEIF